MMELQRASGDTSEYNMVRAIFLNLSHLKKIMWATIQHYDADKMRLDKLN
jgi:hypothetical protein